MSLKWFGVGAGSVVVLAALVGLVLAWPRMFPKKTVAQRLDEAVLLKDSSRERALKDVAEDPLATATQIKRAGQVLLEMSAYESALAVAERWSARFPDDAAARILEARALIGLRQGRRAELAIERAASLNPSDAQPDLVLADLKEMQGDYSGALEALSKAMKKQPSRSLAARRGYLLSQVGRLDEASDALTQLLQKRFDAEDAAELGFVRYRQNQLPEAVSLLKKALKENPKSAKAHWYMGAVHYRQGHSDLAEKEYREADSLAPDDPRALIALCQIRKAGGDAAGEEAVRKEIDSRFGRQAAELKKQCD